MVEGFNRDVMKEDFIRIYYINTYIDTYVYIYTHTHIYCIYTHINTRGMVIKIILSAILYKCVM